MPDEHDDRLEQLRNDLESAAIEGSPRAREIIEYVDAYLEVDEPSDADQETFREQLAEALLHFEVTHPRLSGVLARVMDSLSAAGI